MLLCLPFNKLLLTPTSTRGLCGINKAASRDDLYAMRQHVCGDTDLWKTDGCYLQYGGKLKWTGGPQQTCWDAFENILNQCRPEGPFIGNHCGSWTLNGQSYYVHGCSSSC
jgi:hypothetical protein